MKILACGSRDFNDEITIYSTLASFLFPGRDTLIHGDCRGADRIAGGFAKGLGCEVIAVPAKWNEHDREGASPVPCKCPAGEKTCKVAGIRRNQLMLDEHKPDLVIAFTHDLAASRGTADMVKRAKKSKVKVMVFGQ